MMYELKQLSDGWWIVSITDCWYGPYPSEGSASGAMSLLIGGAK